jgi:DNA replicative helicase MCM subunit Mcm2 (Cdc46/Mcm family)
MNPLEIIENGIVDGNWAMVCRGYEDLTGKIIKTKGISNSPNQLIKQIEELLNDYKKTIILNPEKSESKINIKPSDLDKIGKSKEPVVFEEYGSVPGDKNKPGYYGNITKPLTEDVPPEEINKNIEKAAITKERKTKRNPPKKYNIKCSQCEQNFESDRQESKDFGQKCPKCLQDTINGKVLNG